MTEPNIDALIARLRELRDTKRPTTAETAWKLACAVVRWDANRDIATKLLAMLGEE